jgi:hypothetical protein
MHARLCTGSTARGTLCRAVALTGSSFCFFHHRRGRRTRRQHRVGCVPAVRLGPLGDRAAILRALTRIAQALAAGTLPLERAPALLQRIHAAGRILDLRELAAVRQPLTLDEFLPIL